MFNDIHVGLHIHSKHWKHCSHIRDNSTIRVRSKLLILIYVEILNSLLVSFFMNGYLLVGYELSAELTYPEPEGTSTGLLNSSGQVFGIAFVMAYSEILDRWSVVGANITMAVVLCVGSVLTAIIRSDLRRQTAQSVQN